MKNPNGYGSVYKLKGNRRRPWVARVTTGWTDNGRQKFHIIGYRATKAEAMQLLASHHVNPISPKAGITWGELYAEWAENKYRDLTKKTRQNYEAAWKYYLSRYSTTPVKDLRASHMQAVVNACQEKGQSRSAQEKVRAVAVMLFDYAMQNDIVSKNYAKFVRLPKAQKTKKGRFSDLHIKRLEQSDLPWVDTILIMIYTGLRVGELLSLTRFNVDMDRQIITGGIKTDAGKNRAIPIHPKISLLVKARLAQGGERLISNEKGKPLSPKAYRKRYYAALEQLGLPRLTPHACRHTFGSLMAEAGVAPSMIQRIIGHSRYSTTADIYTHLDEKALREAIGKL